MNTNSSISRTWIIREEQRGPDSMAAYDAVGPFTTAARYSGGGVVLRCHENNVLHPYPPKKETERYGLKRR